MGACHGRYRPNAQRRIAIDWCSLTATSRSISYAVRTMDLDRLVILAKEARARAYAPYSKFFVGAAVLSATGKIYTGCNVENATYGATICAERSAICSMIAAGEKSYTAIAVFTDANPPATPCGICRQVLAEFADDAIVVVATPRMKKRLSLSALLPERFALLTEEP